MKGERNISWREKFKLLEIRPTSLSFSPSKMEKVSEEE